MEFLRFGSSIPGTYWGCCAVCIIQDFNQDPDKLSSIELVSGDGGEPLGGKFLGKTWKEIFYSRLRIGTFNTRDMPNHAFFAVLTECQLDSTIGKKWLQILKDTGFEFIRTVDNSVYSGPSLLDKEVGEEDTSPHPNHIFALFRNIGDGAVGDPHKAPHQWEALGDCTKTQREVWDEIGPAKFYNRPELEQENVPIYLAGRRSPNPQELANCREKRNKTEPVKKVAAPFG